MSNFDNLGIFDCENNYTLINHMYTNNLSVQYKADYIIEKIFVD